MILAQTASPGPSPTPTSVIHPLLSGNALGWILAALFFLALVVLLAPVILSVAFKSRTVGSLFEVPYITWFLLHYSAAALGLIAVVALGVDGVIDGTAVAALLGGLFGYVLGSASQGRPAQSAPPTASPELKVTDVIPSTGKAGQTVAVMGTGMANAKSVSFGGQPGTNLRQSGTGALLVDVPAGAGAVSVTVALQDGTPATWSGKFTYLP